MRLSLDRTNGGFPLYVQLADALQALIADQRMAPGDLLPSENVLASHNGVSRATVIKAFDLLIERGRVVRSQGRGSFVSSPPMERALPELTGFSEHIESLGLVPGNRLLGYSEFAPGDAGRPESPFGREERIVVVERLRSVDGTPVGLHRTVVSARLATEIGLTAERAATPGFSFYDLLRRHGLAVEAGEETLRAINADARDAGLLEVEPGAALMEAVRESRGPSGTLIEFAHARYLGSHYRYTVRLAPEALG
ncbi:GntR family transcriptional regulator [Ruicaihuangia caeni]|uniref:GntR family transcriptional regulator n=1 Tax=Ruicaihuangia caeni TaxID=3042517 RepID=A0AAW6TCC2_9MICO|nr:GntR family transcriptional regulator [Klugiella sp. YN-L-19]MDI2099237.1 GntR family transcriptional regulator [Klugiella sp. YN-L-19]